MFGSDAGMIVTNNRSVYTQLKLLRNHGLINRDVVDLLGYNSRMGYCSSCCRKLDIT